MLDLTIVGQIDPVAFRLLGWPVRWYGLLIGLGMVIAYVMVMREAKRKQIPEEKMSDILFWTIIFGFIGARIYYVIFRLDYYLANPHLILQVWQGGIAIYGGIIGGVITIYVLSRRYGVKFFDVLDIAAPALLVAQIIGRWGNFINQEAYGYETSRTFLETLRIPEFIINQMYIDGSYYHPTFLYESLWNLVGLIIILILREKKQFFKEGEVAATYIVWYGLGRVWIEGMRMDSLYLGPLRVSQWLSVVLVIAGISFMIYRRKTQPDLPYYSDNRI
ncbi:prolipoprotein diacylglyceryl transferase [Fundicoccus culcitae]|uniref:Phosphatidylglycerol--prolipoprotein diacylglyceryl transferase n=1 Tax=Fundicoccus culcitae TaxID=2969821 RepID=A0ABY5P2H6_9LACT|nr:prolipoprotein diacylglyceryl transferase [Fundicoccus culcitae]UUX32921.1 prolipoprotein diacylglyceryl transferase [Fundicoccus culcitae]